MKVIIIEDEKLASDNLVAMIQKIDSTVEIVKIIDNVKKAIAWLSEQQPDLIFMDIHLGDDICFSIFDKVKVTAPIIFTTAYNQYAIRAFKLNSVDYLLKPFSEEDLQFALDKFKSQTGKTAFDVKKLLETIIDKPTFQERFMVVSGQKIKSILIDQVAYFLSEGRYVKLVTKTGEKYLLDQSLESVEHKVDPNHFFRVNRQVIVGFDSIQQMIVWSKSRVKLELKPVTEFDVVVSIDNSGEFKRWLNR
ncbi:LytR/AlgR family response regulator transcription factor [Flavobacterium sp.]|uniref:LytR/AlgR family response regulator transcription factor n=1 Tax=Flavobacterium sp. TaxID=239 RepID=UPI002FDE86D0